MSALGWSIVSFVVGLVLGVVLGLYLWFWVAPENPEAGQE